MRSHFKVLGALAALALSGPLPAAAEPPGTPILGISELKLGGLYHDVPGLWSGFAAERPAADLNVEVLFLPWVSAFGGYLRPAIGGTINFNGDTSKAYADLRWEIEAPSGVFFAIGMGAAIHNGELELVNADRKALGARVLFHPSAEIGYRFDGSNSVSLFFDHVSNGYTRRDNEGMDTIGLRFGHRFGHVAVGPPPEAPITRFAGAYIGAAAGYQFEGADWFALSASRDQTRGFSYAGFAGINWQSGRAIFGLEADAAPMRDSLAATCAAPSILCAMDVSGLYSVRARFGWVIGNSMLYGSGGVAIATWDNNAFNTATGQQLGGLSATNFGVAVGGGIEHKLTPNLALRAEVMHYGLPGRDLSIQGVGTATDQFQTTVVRGGIVWYFW
jgi:opacity protein-like surface antigen